MSHAMCHMSYFFYKLLKLIVEGLLSTGPTPSSLGNKSFILCFKIFERTFSSNPAEQVFKDFLLVKILRITNKKSAKDIVKY